MRCRTKQAGNVEGFGQGSGQDGWTDLERQVFVGRAGGEPDDDELFSVSAGLQKILGRPAGTGTGTPWQSAEHET